MTCDQCNNCRKIEYTVSLTPEQWRSMTGKTIKNVEYEQVFQWFRVTLDDDSIFIASTLNTSVGRDLDKEKKA